MDKKIALEFIKSELSDMWKDRNLLSKAIKEERFRDAEHILGRIEYNNCARIRNLLNKRHYAEENWDK